MADSDSAEKFVSRKDAASKGLKHYFTGEPCRRGHVAVRRVSSSACTVCSRDNLSTLRASRREHYRALDRRQKDKDREKLRARDIARYYRDPEKSRERVRNYYRRNAEKVKAKAISRRRKLKSDNDPRHFEYLEKNRAKVRDWAKRNPEKYRSLLRNTKAKRKGVVGKHTASDIKDIRQMQGGKCAHCAIKLKDKFHIDHIIAVARGGTNFRQNLQLLCIPCNLKKGAFDQIDVMRAMGRLL